MSSGFLEITETSLTKHLIQGIQDLFHVVFNNFEMAVFLSFFNLFTTFFLHYVNVIFKKRVPTNKMVVYCFCVFETALQEEWCDFKVYKNAFELEILKMFAVIVSYEQTGMFSSNFRHSYKNV